MDLRHFVDLWTCVLVSMDLWTHVVMYELVDVIYICLSMWKEKKQNVTSLPRGAVGKGTFVECFCNYARQLWEKFSQLGCSQLCRA
jgi:hypothetical protein